ncbi:acetylpolyamine aminohydrolase [Ignicoccus pacificus DSM 13166]|uniref:Acetylpolyamine aminohydrolase n=1 Tax=Ignicoccus pacificus DSM 13166 TaxID=940294 RepID=A0A977PKQ5_9CREN|nr:acetylpolyamine aminohydrolase [Ignicoccus pacificus DSM 13166]
MKVVWSDLFTKTFFSPPSLVEAWTSRMEEFKRRASKYFQFEEPLEASLEDFKLVHCEELVEEVRKLNDVGGVLDYGDTYIYPGSLEVLLADLGGVYRAYEIAKHQGFGYTPYGGLHHAHRCSAAGFCPLNDLAVLIEKLTKEGKRIAYLDFDVHHGDGTQEIFYERDDVLTLSLHMYHPGFYPGTGHYSELGRGRGLGYSLNVPLPPGTGDEAYQLALKIIVKRAIESFEPDVIVTQMGVDGHKDDPLGGALNLSTNTFKAIGELLASFNVPVVGAGGGGYGRRSVKAMLAELSGAFGIGELWEEVREEKTESNPEAISRVMYVKKFFEDQLDWF